MDESTQFTMPVAPAYGGGMGSGFGFGGDWAWILLLLVLFGGWGNGGYGGGFGMDGLYPWMNNSQNINGGFRDQMLNTSIGGIQNSITSGFGDVQNSLCSGFAGVNASITNAQMSALQSNFALQSQLAQCCCDNRAATQDLKYTLATEACADRAAVSSGVQSILDKLCQLELDAKDDTIAQLRSQVNELSRSASQTAQTAAILANNEAQTAALEKYLAPIPVPAYVVANPNCCGNTCGVNCGCGV